MPKQRHLAMFRKSDHRHRFASDNLADAEQMALDSKFQTTASSSVRAGNFFQQ